jgi:hypothetical protein
LLDGLDCLLDALAYLFDGLDCLLDALAYLFDGLDCLFDALAYLFDGLIYSLDGLSHSLDGLDCLLDGLSYSLDGLDCLLDGLDCLLALLNLGINQAGIGDGPDQKQGAIKCSDCIHSEDKRIKHHCYITRRIFCLKIPERPKVGYYIDNRYFKSYSNLIQKTDYFLPSRFEGMVNFIQPLLVVEELVIWLFCM